MFILTRRIRQPRSCCNGVMATPGNIGPTGAPTVALTASTAQTAVVAWAHCLQRVNGCAWKFRPARSALKARPSKAWASQPLMVAWRGTPAAKPLLAHRAAAQPHRQPAAAAQSPARRGWMILFHRVGALEV